MPGQRDRVIIDTNIWISLLLTRDFLKFDQLFFGSQNTLILSAELTEEFLEVIQRPKFKKYFNWNDVQKLMLKIEEIADFIEVSTKLSICRDPEDDFLLALAIDGKATHLLTGDKDLLVLEKIEKTKILTLSAYLASK